MNRILNNKFLKSVPRRERGVRMAERTRSEKMCGRSGRLASGLVAIRILRGQAAVLAGGEDATAAVVLPVPAQREKSGAQGDESADSGDHA